jgi:protein gp37
MSKETGISWTDHTWNGWEGCSKISPGCTNCYMFQELERYGRDPGRVRRTKTWRDPERWNEQAERAGRIDKVFTCSLSDFFHQDADAWRPAAWELIRRCTHLQFQILTKRPLLISDRLPADWGQGYPNVWLGVSIESNDYVWRADVLRQIPARVRWISAEPLLGPLPDLDLTGFQWLVVGGESGPGHRDMDHAWARQLRDKAMAKGAAFFFKQSSGARRKKAAGYGTKVPPVVWRRRPMPMITGRMRRMASTMSRQERLRTWRWPSRKHGRASRNGTSALSGTGRRTTWRGTACSGRSSGITVFRGSGGTSTDRRRGWRRWSGLFPRRPTVSRRSGTWSCTSCTSCTCPG